jgi:hypothetical protein
LLYWQFREFLSPQAHRRRRCPSAELAVVTGGGTSSRQRVERQLTHLEKIPQEEALETRIPSATSIVKADANTAPRVPGFDAPWGVRAELQ